MSSIATPQVYSARASANNSVVAAMAMRLSHARIEAVRQGRPGSGGEELGGAGSGFLKMENASDFALSLRGLGQKPYSQSLTN